MSSNPSFSLSAPGSVLSHFRTLAALLLPINPLKILWISTLANRWILKTRYSSLATFIFHVDWILMLASALFLISSSLALSILAALRPSMPLKMRCRNIALTSLTLAKYSHLPKYPRQTLWMLLADEPKISCITSCWRMTRTRLLLKYPLMAFWILITAPPFTASSLSLFLTALLFFFPAIPLATFWILTAISLKRLSCSSFFMVLSCVSRSSCAWAILDLILSNSSILVIPIFRAAASSWLSPSIILSRSFSSVNIDGRGFASS
mmetsp:Transcript_3436/g.6409  ORF Transcript_3436/g.6409 Transcript_3436/m.6409 type:complete len:265 (-) Transcript_3436:1066-1860(-)